MTVRQFQHRTRYTTHMSSHGGQQPARARMLAASFLARRVAWNGPIFGALEARYW